MATDEVIDRLYALPPGEFTAARNDAVTELRRAGDREAAERVKALRKPTAAAERQERAALELLIEAGGEEVRQSLLAATVDDEAARQVLEGRLVRELEPAGFGTLLAHVEPGGRRLRPVEKRPGRAGRTARAPEREPRAPEQEPRAPERPEVTAEEPPEAETAARARLAEARSALAAAEADERQARRRWDDARRQVDQARDAVDQALHDLDRLPGDT